MALPLAPRPGVSATRLPMSMAIRPNPPACWLRLTGQARFKGATSWHGRTAPWASIRRARRFVPWTRSRGWPTCWRGGGWWSPVTTRDSVRAVRMPIWRATPPRQRCWTRCAPRRRCQPPVPAAASRSGDIRRAGMRRCSARNAHAAMRPTCSYRVWLQCRRLRNWQPTCSMPIPRFAGC